MFKRLFLFLSCAPLLASAAVYKWSDAEGVHYSDQPRPGAERIELPQSPLSAPLSSRLPGQAQSQPKEKTSATDSVYKTFSIAQPDKDQTIRSNEGIVTVAFFIRPTLQNSHKIRVFVDGKKLKNDLTTTHFLLRGVERGSHTIRAEILSQKGERLIGASAVTFHLRKESILQPNKLKDDSNGGSGSGANGGSPGSAPFTPNYKPAFKGNFGAP